MLTDVQRKILSGELAVYQSRLRIFEKRMRKQNRPYSPAEKAELREISKAIAKLEIALGLFDDEGKR